MSVNLVQKSVDALAVMREHGLDTKTDGINRAIQLYAWWLHQETLGYGHCVKDKDGRVSDVIMFT